MKQGVMKPSLWNTADSASHRNCAGTPSTLLAVFSKAPLQRQCSVKHPFKITLYMTLSTPSPESCTIIKILNTVPSAIILRVQPLGSRVDEWWLLALFLWLYVNPHVIIYNINTEVSHREWYMVCLFAICPKKDI